MVKFMRCKRCGRIVGVLQDSGSPLICCGEPMEELVPNTTDAAGEKHVPVISIDGNIVTVKVGEVPHPMMEEHYIQWVYLKTAQGGARKALKPGAVPEATFVLSEGDVVEAAYEYCNLHGLWVAQA